MHGNQGSTANEYPAPDESKRVLHTGRAELVTSPAIKDGAYDQEPIEISTNERSVILQLGSPDEDHRRAKFKRGSEKPNLMDAVNGNATENL